MAEVTGRDRAGGPPRPPAPAGPARRLEAIDVLRLILSDEDLLPSGRAQMVSLHAAMRKLGPDWSRFSSKVVDLAERTLRQRIEPGDVFFPVDETLFLVIFDRLEGEAAARRIDELVDEVLRRLFGEQVAGDAAIRRLVVTRALTGAEGTRRRRGGPPPAQEVEKSVADDVDYDRYFPEPKVDTSRHDTGVLPVSMKWRFAPLWDAEYRILTTFVCRPLDGRGPEGERVDVPWLYGQAEDPRIGHVDAQILARAAQALAAMQAGGGSHIIACPVHFFTLQSRARRQAYLRQFRHLPEQRDRFLVMELHHVPAGVPFGRLQQLAADLRPYCRNLALRVEPTEGGRPQIRAAMRMYREAGFDFAGMDLAGIRDEMLQRRVMDRFAAAAAAAQLKAYVLGLTSTSQTLAAMASGFGLIQSEAIAAPVEAPTAMYRFPVDRLFRGVAAGGSADESAG